MCCIVRDLLTTLTKVYLNCQEKKFFTEKDSYIMIQRIKKLVIKTSFLFD